MAQSSAIGIFDSGVGGTSIFKAIHQLLPLEKTIYLADSKNAPYGIKSKKDIVALCRKNTELLLDKGCKIIVVACNTATTNAINELRQEYQVPFIGIEPAIKPAAINSTRNCVGILATKGTLSSQLFAKTSALFAKNTKVIEVDGSSLVPLIEAGKINTAETFTLLSSLIKPLLTQEIDHLVLGCTHFPYLIPLLRKLLSSEVRIIDSGEAVARQTQAVLQASGLLANTQQGEPEFYSNKNPRILQQFIQGSHQAIYLDF